MPTISIKKRLLDHHLKKEYTQTEIDDLCFAYGLEVDDVVKERNDDGVEEVVYKIEIPANRYDLLCVEGLCKALLIFQKKIEPPHYKVCDIENPRRIIIGAETADVRRFAIGAVLKGVKLDKDRYASFIDLQDKLHQNICRKRLLASVGTHDLDFVKGNVVYCAKQPKDIIFQPLNQLREFNAEELMEFYADSHLREYLPIIKDKALYPVFYDEDGTVLSLPPIINSNKTKITLNTKNIFIEVTGLNLKKVEIVLETLITTFSQYCSTPFCVEPVEVVYSDGTSTLYPSLRYREMVVDRSRMNSKIGVDINVDKTIELLHKMGVSTVAKKSKVLKLKIPPNRHDILHECDVAEDLGLAYGFNNIKRCLPESNTVAEPLPLNKLTDGLRSNVAMCGWTEVLTFSLCSTDDVSMRLRKNIRSLDEVVKIANPKTIDFQVVRNSLLPGILKTLSSNKDMPIPLKLFEIQDVVFKDENSETGCRNQRNLCAVYYSKTGGFEVIHGLLDRVMQLLEAGLEKTENNNSNMKFEYSVHEAKHPSYFEGRCAEVALHSSNKTSIVVGTFGILHPEVMTHFNLNMPCSAMELNIEPFL